MLELVVPALVDRVVEGALVPGLAVHLRAAIGSEWRNGEARYRALLRYETAPGQRLRLAERSEAAWNEMRDEVGAANGDAVVDGVKSVLCVEAEFAGTPGTPAAGEDGEEIDELRPRFQKRIMLVRARRRRMVATAMMAALPSKDPVRVAWRNRPNMAIFNTVPTAKTRFTRQQWELTIGHLLGIAVPALDAYVGTRFADQEADDSHCVRTLTATGGGLDLFGGVGNGRAAMSAEIEEHLVEAAKSVGISGAVAQPVGEFVDAVLDEVKRQEYKDNGAKSRYARQHKALLVPDIRLPGVPVKLAADVRESEVDDQLCTRLYDVKTFGELRPYYGVSWNVKPVEKRERACVAEMLRRARKADYRYNGCAPDAGRPDSLEGPGPIQARLLGVPHGIQGLAIGAFGETGKGISDYFNLLATIATKRVDRAVGGGCRMARRWGLCHSERHTYGAMKGLLQRRFSRVAVRGAAKVRLRALQAITGRIQGRFEVEEGKFYSAEDADRATSTNYLYQEPDCRVERLPDALASTLPGGG